MGSEFLAREDLENMMTLVLLGLTFPVFVGPDAKVLLQIVHFYKQPKEQCHQQTEISSFASGEVLVSH